MKLSCVRLLMMAFLPLTLNAQQPQALTVGGKARAHLRDAVGLMAIIGSAAGAGIEQWRNDPAEWKLGAEGYGRRYASNHGYLIIEDIVAFGLDSTLHTDPRYHPSIRSRFSERLKYAIKETFITNTDSGKSTFNWAAIGGNLATGQLSNLWYPNSSNTIGDGFVRGGISIGGSTLSNVASEFWPDIRRKFRR